jgi:hypothetical protein
LITIGAAFDFAAFDFAAFDFAQVPEKITKKASKKGTEN